MMPVSNNLEKNLTSTLYEYLRQFYRGALLGMVHAGLGKGSARFL